MRSRDARQPVTELEVTRDARGVATVTMNRPAVANAFDDHLVGLLHDAAVELARDDDVRVVVLTGAGEAFSAGADLRWMRSMREASYEDNVADALRLGRMLRALYDLPKPLVGRVHGAAIGGGAGLVAVCDVAVAVADATFGFTEVALGLAPAVISPYVVRKVGRSFARSAFVSGMRFGADRAREAGLVHEVAADIPALDAAVAEVVGACRRAGPQAVAAAKRLPDLAMGPLDDVATDTARMIAGLRGGEEGQAGMAAFLEGDTPPWVADQ